MIGTEWVRRLVVGDRVVVVTDAGVVFREAGVVSSVLSGYLRVGERRYSLRTGRALGLAAGEPPMWLESAGPEAILQHVSGWKIYSDGSDDGPRRDWTQALRLSVFKRGQVGMIGMDFTASELGALTALVDWPR